MLIRVIASLTFFMLSANLCALNGIVVNSSGSGIAGVKIEIKHASGSSVIYSAEGGHFNDNLAFQAINQVTFKHGGYETKTLNNPNINLQISLVERNYVLQGWAINEQGLGVANVTIDAGPLGQLTTDSEGHFAVNAKFGTMYSLKGHLVDYYLGEPVKGVLEGDTERRILVLLD